MLGKQVGLGPGHNVLDGDEAPPPSIFCPNLCSQMAGWIKTPLGMEVGLGPSDIVLDGDAAPLSKIRGQSLPFSVHVYCGQRAGWMKMPLGIEVCLGPGHIVLDGAQLPQKGAQPPIFGACLLSPNG